MKPIALFILFFIVSCAGYVDSVHRSIDREEQQKLARSKNNDPLAPYRGKDKFRPENDKRPIKNPVTYSLGNDSSGQMRPPVKRDYRPQRYKADDFTDNDSDGSLWANKGSSAALFTYQNDKHTGDMVIINVLENLRNQISSELKRTFPDMPTKKDAQGNPNVPAAAAPGAAASADQEMDMKVYDKISSTVMEEISKDYMLLKGRKEVIFKKEKRSIEVQALVSRKDIMENDYVNSDKLLESRVYILGTNQ